jgi:hypothetical protein
MTPAQYLRWLAIHSTQPTAVRLLAKTITVEEWNSKCVYKATLTAIQSKSRSPKLSKVLAALGCQQQHLDLILSATPKAKSTQQSYITQDPAYVLDQGNTVHYSSCQATKHETSHGISRIARPEEDIRDDLWLWVIGKPFFEDSQGFICRAKLRLLTATNGDVRGLYIERIYGSTAALMSDIETLYKWWTLYCTQRDMPVYPVYREAWYSDTDNMVRLYCKSAGYGYQDTLYSDSSREQRFVPILDGRSIMYRAYYSRIKSAGVYDVPITAVTYNPQNGSYTTPVPTTKRWRGILGDHVHKTVVAAISVLGNPDPKTMQTYKYCSSCKAQWQGRVFYISLSVDGTGYDVSDDDGDVLTYRFGILVVHADVPELGFYKAKTQIARNGTL